MLLSPVTVAPWLSTSTGDANSSSPGSAAATRYRVGAEHVGGTAAAHAGWVHPSRTSVAVVHRTVTDAGGGGGASAAAARGLLPTGSNGVVAPRDATLNWYVTPIGRPDTVAAVAPATSGAALRQLPSTPVRE